MKLLFMDVDKFKSINDKFGHVEGDMALITVAETLKKVFDGYHAFITRYGGDEFAVVISCSNEEIHVFLSTLNKQLIEASEGKPYTLELSYGLADYNRLEINNADDLIKVADKKMYECKLDKTYSH